MNFLHRIIALVMKELQGLFGDPSGRVLIFMPVVLQSLLFPFAATLDVTNASLAIYNRDSGAPATELVQRFAKSTAFKEIIQVTSEQQMAEAVESREALLAVSIPENFSRELAGNKKAPVQVILDGRRSNSAQIAFGYLQGIVEGYMKDRSAASGKVMPSEVVSRYWFNENLIYRNFTLANLVAIITTIGALILTALSVAREREQGTFDQLLVSPLTPEMIMIGKAVPAIIVAFIQASIILTVAVFIYHVPFRGNLLLLYLGMFFYATSLVGVGLFISSLCSTQQQAFLGAFAFMMPATMLSGFSSPVENMPHWLQILTWPNPVRHFLEIVKGVFLKDASVERVLSLMLPLVVIGFITLTVSSILFRRKSA
jgi:ABC-2 type transport system permease protein